MTTDVSLANTGNSTCRGGIANRSAYWVPAYSVHGDYFEGWKQEVLNTFVENCTSQAGVDCHSDLLGDGTSIY